ncbi:hairy/enhancer-of-split related with YRPW motif protein [Culicoides brevitarsis]|uniref:hairy/enhancer-of-split related with YRPW motif protein n=1 Tax=Culicoides brevitarsis TaxID=469753 RepID=UPI00307C2516
MDQHWLYPPTHQQTWTPSRGLKRGISESDCDDGSSLSSKDHASPGESDPCQLVSRKKRRGVIEKKRRDKINNSLVELKRLVPSCFEKQGSSKLEKAEILQLTVDHLKNLHAKGNDPYAYDHQRFALEYHITGFRECVSEVARYLATIEGLDLQNPLRLRLMSHLQCFMAQRELSARSTASSATNAYAACPPPVAPPTVSSTLYQQSYQQMPQSMPSVAATHIPRPLSHESEQVTSTSYNNNKQLEQDAGGHVSPVNHQMQGTPYGNAESHHHIEHHHGSTYIDLTNSRNSFQPYATTYPGEHPAYANQATYNHNSSKPYRPWGAEMAY